MSVDGAKNQDIIIHDIAKFGGDISGLERVERMGLMAGSTLLW